MFYSTTDGQYIQEGVPFEINEVQYPANWLNLATPEQKAELGLEEVIATNSPADQTYYWVSETLDKATLTYTNIPKDLDSVKSTSVSQVNNTAYTTLLPTDWMVVKSVETSTPMRPEWNAWRESVRLTAKNAVTAINSATDVDGVASAVSSIVWPTQP